MGVDDSNIIGRTMAPARLPISPLLLAVSLCVSLSILYQIYIFEFENGDLTGGGASRLTLKLFASLLFVVAVRRYLSVAAFSLNLLLKLPLLFVAVTILVVSPFLLAAYTQALNLLFFLPILCIDWDRPGGAELYETIWRIIAIVVLVQLALDPLFKLYFNVQWSNAAVVGGMGNPNVFGIFLITSGLATTQLLQSRLKSFAPILFLATVLTGSLAASIVGCGCLLLQLARHARRAPLRLVIVLGVVVVVSSASAVYLDLVDTSSIEHAFQKLLGLEQLLSGNGRPDSDTFSVRIEYLINGLGMLADSPLAIIVGHPNAVPMYNGDGLWTSFLVTYGLPVTLSFLAVNLVVIARALRVGSRDLLFSAAVVAAMLAFFVTNRILDYWPAALLYLLAFSYLTNKGVRRYSAVVVAP
jgi:hypothetical protein